MSKFGWLRDIARVVPLILPLIPGMPPELTPFIAKGVLLAEQAESLPEDPAAKKAAKLQIAVDEVNNGIAAVNAARPDSIDPLAVNAAVLHGINATVATLNAIHSAK